MKHRCHNCGAIDWSAYTVELDDRHFRANPKLREFVRTPMPGEWTNGPAIECPGYRRMTKVAKGARGWRWRTMAWRNEADGTIVWHACELPNHPSMAEAI
ncbi:MAG: hypothetical protein ACR2MN_04270 [Acidimicrobiales bacterium]